MLLKTAHTICDAETPYKEAIATIDAYWVHRVIGRS